jgi:hypothetical protein
MVDFLSIASVGSSLLGGILGGNSAKKASKAAAQAQLQAQREALAYQQKVRDENIAYAQPFQQLGQQGLNALSDPTKNFTASPGYQYRLNQGLEGVTNNYATRGLLNSGSALKGLNDYAQNQASNEYGNWWGQQMGLVGVGQNALGAITGTNSQFANNASDLALAGGQTNALNQLNQGAINAGMWGLAGQAGANALSQFIKPLPTSAVANTGWSNVGLAAYRTPGINPAANGLMNWSRT